MNLEHLLACQLIRKPSITPDDCGCLDLIYDLIKPLGFQVTRMDFGNTSNLYARMGSSQPNLCFVGHTDVVSPLDITAWMHPPFDGKIVNDTLHGRGTNDMKGAIASFISAAKEFIETSPKMGSISILLTSDEEGEGHDGVPKIIDWLKEKNEKIDLFLVGEPTSASHVGETVKFGSRGSLNALLEIQGKAGHVGYPEFAKNPIPSMINFLEMLKSHQFDEGNINFTKTNLEITSIDVANHTTNLIPNKVSSRFNVRFNDLHTGESLKEFLSTYAKNHIKLPFLLDMKVTGDAYCSDIKPFRDLFEKSIEEVTGEKPIFSTGGATSDGRFLYKIAPTYEVGLYYSQAHVIDEQISLSDLTKLKNIYGNILKNYFGNNYR